MKMKRIGRVLAMIMVCAIFLAACGKAENLTIDKSEGKKTEDSASQDNKSDSEKSDKSEKSENDDTTEEKIDTGSESGLLAGLDKLINGNDTDVIVTINGDPELNLTGDVAEVIRKVEEDNGLVYNNNLRLLHVNNNGDVYVKKGEGEKSFEILSKSKDYFVTIDGGIFSSLSISNKEVPGYLNYEFYESAINGENLKIKISTLKDWDGAFSSIENYMMEKNGLNHIDEEDEDKKKIIEALKTAPVVYFKNGKIVPLSDIIEKYWDEAKKITEEYGDIYNYYMQTKNWSIEEALKYIHGSVLGKYLSHLRTSQLNSTGKGVAIFNLLTLQMIEWADNKDGSVQNYGEIDYDSSRSLNIYVHCTHEEFIKVHCPYYMEENGELIDYNPGMR